MVKTGARENASPKTNHQYVDVPLWDMLLQTITQIAIYVVVDRPNVATQDVRNIQLVSCGPFWKALPYLGIFMTEELTDKEREELEQLQIEIRTPVVSEEDTTAEGEDGENTGDTTAEGGWNHGRNATE